MGSGSAKNSLHCCFLTAELSQKQMVLSRETDKYSVCFVLFCFEKRGRRIRRGVHVCVCQPIATSIGTIKKSTCRALPLFSTVMPVKKKKYDPALKKKKEANQKGARTNKDIVKCTLCSSTNSYQLLPRKKKKAQTHLKRFFFFLSFCKRESKAKAQVKRKKLLRYSPYSCAPAASSKATMRL